MRVKLETVTFYTAFASQITNGNFFTVLARETTNGSFFTI
jgi:hypothetical protein